MTMTYTENFALRYIFAAIFFIQASRSELAVTWICPSATDKYGPGDIMIVRWGTPNDVLSPVFRLCSSVQDSATLIKDNNGTGSNDACGSAVQSVVERSAGSYLTSLTVPNVTEESSFYITMEDSSNKASSPKFRISSNVVTTEVPNDANSGDPPSPALETKSLAHGSTTPTGQLNPSSVVPSYLTVEHAPPPVAAYAVPLSFVGAILLASIILAFRHCRQLKNERATNVEKIAFSRQSSFSNSVYTVSTSQKSNARFSPESIHGTNVLHGNWSSPKTSRPEARSQTRQAFPAAYFARLSGQHSPRITLPSPTGPPSRCLTSSNPTTLGDSDSSNVSVTNLVLSDYGLSTSALSLSHISPPDKLHVRDQADTYFLYKPLPPILQNPISTVTEGIYDTLAYTGSKQVGTV